MGKPSAGLAALCCMWFSLVADTASACSCASVQVCHAFWEADAVFIGTADVAFSLGGTQRTLFSIRESFRGPERGTIETLSEGVGGSCDYGFRHGVEYLVFARRESDRTWKVFLCSRTAPAAQAGDDVAFARSIAAGAAGGARVFGSIDIHTLDSRQRVIATSPFSYASVILDGDERRTIQADLQGRYEFTGVRPGRYRLAVRTSPAFIPIPPVDVHVKGPGHCVARSFRALKRQ